MQLALKLSRIKPSATLTINAKAQELRAQGKSVLSLAVGEPDFPTPEHVKLAAIEAIEANFTRYTPVPGIPELRSAAAGYFNKFYGISAQSESIIITNGGKQALYNLFSALLNGGDEVLIPAPYWVSYPDMVLLAGALPVSFPTRPENNFLASLEDLERACTPRTRMLILNTPSNPTGCHYTQEQLDAIMEWALSRGVFVVSDEIYDQLVYAPAKPASLAKWFERAPESVAITNGLAKSFAMTGWRVGYALAHPDLIKGMSKIQGQSTSNICSIAQKAALAALTGPFDGVRVMREAYVRRRDLALEIISTWPGAVCPKPDGAFYLFAHLDAFFTADAPDSTALCAKILDQANVAAVPGAAFGDDKGLRFSYALADELLIEALTRVGKVLLKK